MALIRPLPQFGASKTVTKDARPVLLSTDIDGTLISWQKRPPGYNELALTRTINAVRDAYDQGLMAVHLNTGRGLTSVQQAVRATQKDISKLPVDYLSLNNGQELYVNAKHLRADTWILSLKESDRERGWSLKIHRNTGWESSAVTRAKTDVFSRNGFQEIQAPEMVSPGYEGIRTYEKQEGGRRIIVQSFDNQPGFKLFSWDANGQNLIDEDMAIGRKLTAQIRAALCKRPEPIQTDLKKLLVDQNGHHFAMFVPVPRGIHKGAAVKELLSRFMSRPQAVITAGDEIYNDADMLLPFRYEVNGKRVRNLPIISGGQRALTEKVRNRQVEAVSSGDLGPAIEKQLAKVGFGLDYTA